tara:strand:+ start:134 stop:346 length:213 start_codon:yes stop_codon:yes gene_type:complete
MKCKDCNNDYIEHKYEVKNLSNGQTDWQYVYICKKCKYEVDAFDLYETYYLDNDIKEANELLIEMETKRN